MTENEAIEVLTDRHTSIGTTKCDDVAWRKLKPAIDTAVNALEEIQQYRAIGTVEEIKEILQIISEGQEDVDECGISIGLLNTLLEYVEYAKIGTVEECREARKRQKPKKLTHEGTLLMSCTCPNCKNVLDEFETWGESRIRVKHNYCHFCGQKLNWSVELV